MKRTKLTCEEFRANYVPGGYELVLGMRDPQRGYRTLKRFLGSVLGWDLDPQELNPCEMCPHYRNRGTSILTPPCRVCPTNCVVMPENMAAAWRLYRTTEEGSWPDE